MRCSNRKTRRNGPQSYSGFYKYQRHIRGIRLVSDEWYTEYTIQLLVNHINILGKSKDRDKLESSALRFNSKFLSTQEQPISRGVSNGTCSHYVSICHWTVVAHSPWTMPFTESQLDLLIHKLRCHCLNLIPFPTNKQTAHCIPYSASHYTIQVSSSNYNHCTVTSEHGYMFENIFFHYSVTQGRHNMTLF